MRKSIPTNDVVRVCTTFARTHLGPVNPGTSSDLTESLRLVALTGYAGLCLTLHEDQPRVLGSSLDRPLQTRRAARPLSTKLAGSSSKAIWTLDVPHSKLLPPFLNPSRGIGIISFQCHDARPVT